MRLEFLNKYSIFTFFLHSRDFDILEFRINRKIEEKLISKNQKYIWKN